MSKQLEENSLKAKVISGGVWASGINISTRALQLIKVGLFAKALGPSGFGIISIALIIHTAYSRLFKFGLDTALVQRDEEDVDHLLDTAMIIKIIRGILVIVVGVIAAPKISNILGDTEAKNLIIVVSMIPLVVAFQNPAVMYFQKDLDFRSKFVYNSFGTLLDFGVSLYLLVSWGEPVAFVIGLLVGEMAKVPMSYLMSAYKPSLDFDTEAAKELLGFGKWMFASSIVIFTVTEGDDALVGWILGVTALGYYQLSYRVSNAPATEVSAVVGSVALPAYSKLQNDTAALRRAYKQVLQATSIVAFPMAAGIILVVPELVPLVLGDAWKSAIVLMQTLAVLGLFRSVEATTGPLFNAIGRPDLSTKILSIRAVLLLALFHPVAEGYGLEGISVLVVLSSICISAPIAIFATSRIIDTDIVDILSTLFPAMLSTVLMTLVVLSFNILITSTTFLTLGAQILLGVVSYATVSAIIFSRTGLFTVTEKLVYTHK